MSSLHCPEESFFFVHGYGGTGKTFLWNALCSTLRARGDIVLAVASSGIASTLLPSGRTAHSRFAIPIIVNEDSFCNINQKSHLADLIRATTLIIWDEVPMVQRFCIEAFDRTMKDLLHSNNTFGGKCVVMGGDFRQLLPVIPRASRATIVDSCISSSYLWDCCNILHLNKNMRLSSSSVQDKPKLELFSKWLLKIGEGQIGLPHDGLADIKIPDDLLLQHDGNSIEAIVLSTYPQLLSHLYDSQYFNDRAILSPTIETVNEINNYMCQMLPGQAVDYFSADSICASSDVVDGFHDLYTPEFLNTVNASGLPQHKLTLKLGVPVMLLRNIDQAAGLCNGTRLIVTFLGKNVIEGLTLNGSNPNSKVLIHRMDLNPSDGNLPFRMKRRQFPLTISFAMTINKSQGQSLNFVGLYLSKPVFTHDQLYVAMSRVKHFNGLKILLAYPSNGSSTTTINVVYREIFRNL